MKNRILYLFMFLGMVLLSGCKSSNNANKENTTSPNAMSIEERSSNEPSYTLEKTEIYVFAAASLNNAMAKVQEMYKEVYPHITVIFNLDSSGTLQTQIEEGAECDIFFSAAMKQMDSLVDGGYIESASIKKFLENNIVLIKPIGGKTEVTGFENIFNAKNIALAGEDVPVGAYAREIFNSLGIWDKVSTMEINEGANVTAVLAAISEASNEVGVVYATDANTVKDSVEVIAQAPVGSLSTPVIYPAGLVNNPDADALQKAAAKDFLAFLSTNQVLAVFEEYGFSSHTQ